MKKTYTFTTTDEKAFKAFITTMGLMGFSPVERKIEPIKVAPPEDEELIKMPEGVFQLPIRKGESEERVKEIKKFNAEQVKAYFRKNSIEQEADSKDVYDKMRELNWYHENRDGIHRISIRVRSEGFKDYTKKREFKDLASLEKYAREKYIEHFTLIRKRLMGQA